MTPRFSVARKAVSLATYRRLVANWPVPALARYAARLMPGVVEVRFRSGERILFRPRSDSVAFGEVFVVSVYDAAGRIPDVRMVWDIGANIGCFSLRAHMLAPGAEIHAFEPCRPSFELLDRTRTLNPRINLRTHCFGFGAADETATVHVRKGLFGEASRYGSAGSAYEIRLRNISSYWKEAGSPPIDVLKIDCEGAEFEIAEAMSTAMFGAVRFLIMEVHAVGRRDVSDLRRLVESRGFSTAGVWEPGNVVTARRNQ